MSRFTLVWAFVTAGVFVPAAFASSLQDYGFDLNGTWYSATTSVPGLVSSSFDAGTGLGTLQFTIDPGKAGTYNLDAWIFDAVGVPFYNEFGVQKGSAAAGQSWQIDIPDYDSDANHTGTIIANTKAGKLDNTNHIPGGADDYFGDCATGSNCNDAASMAMGFSFTLTSDEEEVITLNLSTINSGGFYLEQIHPVDGANTSEADLFFSGNAATKPSGVTPPPPPPNAPEPATLALVGAAGCLLAVAQRRRLFRA